ncbi:helix-turn-helix transcriptional regulator [Actinokineospora auranticolor]|uniref:Transcriptional regulator with XRE-family HTH domain n=1 Tax=Actinokineospora auranticolor TaxID=155976 RepID=A0A2S6GM00_9PSEU|nr:helix-turn-helix transcriptional regulator [Actinokineospora auranticolor]PPK66210.1 transcriptional regulator with XRE-family HTH domain [Actinokineospora auranticolor]
MPNRDRCRRCAAFLRAGHLDILCDPCARVVRAANGLPDPDFYRDTEHVRAALIDHDFGPVFVAVRAHAGLTQEQFADLLDLRQARLSRIENGRLRLSDSREVVRIAATLGIPALLLGFDAGPDAPSDEVEVSEEVDRRDFFGAVAGIVLGATAPPDRPDLLAMLSREDRAPSARALRTTDIVAIREATDAFRALDYRRGGGIARTGAVAVLHEANALHAEAHGPLVHELRLATAELAGMAAWMHYDIERHATAADLWQQALVLARDAEHPRSADLTAQLLLDTAHQALHRDRPEDALRLVRLSAATVAGHRYPAGANTRGYIAMNLAWCHASLGNVEATRRALDQAHQCYADHDPATAAPWETAHLVPAELHAQHGHALWLLSHTDPTHAEQAAHLLGQAVDGYGPDYARSAAVNLPGLAGSLLRVGDLDGAVSAGHRAVSAIEELSSRRAYARLRTLADTAEAHRRHPDVENLRQRIHAVLPAA